MAARVSEGPVIGTRVCLLALLGFAVATPGLGCYSPDYPSGQYTCAQDTDCPDSFACVEVSRMGRRCVRVDNQPGGDSLCTNTGRELAGGVFACNGNFGDGQGGRLCKTGHVCGASPTDATLLAAELPCDALTGFYATQYPVTSEPEGGLCAPKGSASKSLLGCGLETGVTRLAGNCVGPSLHHAIACSADPAGWDCDSRSGFPFGGARRDSQNPVGGVLCCR